MGISRTDSDKRTFIVATIVLVLLVFVKTLLHPIILLDDLWNYNVCRAFAMGYIPYRDYNMVMMPLFIWVFSIPLRFVRTFFCYRIFSALFLSIVAVSVYQTAKESTDSRWGFVVGTSFVLLMDVATYNGIILIIVALLFRYFCKGVNSKKTAVIIGILCALSVLCRQTTGVFLTIAVFILMFRNKEYRKYMIQFIASWTAVMICFAGYLLCTGSFMQFWDYCLFALFAPGQSTAAFYFNSLVSLVLIALGVVCDILLIKEHSDNEDKLHLLFGLMLASIGIPVVDVMHLFYAGVWFIVPIIKKLLFAGKGKSLISPMLVNMITVGICACILFLSAYDMAGMKYSDKYREFRYLPAPGDFLDDYGKIADISDNYRAAGKNVVMFSSCTVVVSIIDEEFRPPYDLFLTGNLGSRSPLSYAEEACADRNNVIVIPDTYNEENWTNPDGILEYVQEHCVPVESYANFTWYVPG